MHLSKWVAIDAWFLHPLAKHADGVRLFGIKAIDAGSRGSSNLHALVSTLTASSIGSQGKYL